MIHRACIGLFLCLIMATRLAAAEEAGMKAEPFKAATRLIEEQVESGLVGAAALLVAHNGKIEVEQAFGTCLPGGFSFRARHVWRDRLVNGDESPWTIKPVFPSSLVTAVSASPFATC
jgi:hypothetical protein